MIQNYIRIDEKYIRQEDIPPDQMKEISRDLTVRLAEGFGYVPVDQKDQDSHTAASGHSSEE